MKKVTTKKQKIKNDVANDFSKSLLVWYKNESRDLPWRKNKNPYNIWVSEIMLQQTQVQTVKAYFAKFIETFPTLKDFAQASENQYLKLWEGLGYYSRVRNMHKTAQIIVSDHGGSFPDSYQELIQLPGIGSYTGAAIASICFNQAIPAIDGNLLRIFSRLNAYGQDISKTLSKKTAFEFFETKISHQKPGDFNQALMDLASLVCLPKSNPKCQFCPLSSFCIAFKIGNPLDFPVRSDKKKRKVEKKTVILVHHNEKILLRKRPSSGLLANLYEFFTLKGHKTREDVLKTLRTNGFNPIKIKKLEDNRHLFSHVEWQMIAYEVFTDQIMNRPNNKKSAFSLSEKTEDYKISNGETFLSSLEDLENHWTLPSAYSKYRNYLLSQ